MVGMTSQWVPPKVGTAFPGEARHGCAGALDPFPPFPNRLFRWSQANEKAQTSQNGQKSLPRRVSVGYVAPIGAGTSSAAPPKAGGPTRAGSRTPSGPAT